MASCRQAAGGSDSPPPLLNGVVYDDDDDDDSDQFDYDLDDDDDWDESEDSNVLCLFCEETFAKMEAFHRHSHEAHGFQLKKFAKKLQLDSISFIKCVNFVRKNKMSAEQLNLMRVNYSKVCSGESGLGMLGSVFPLLLHISP